MALNYGDEYDPNRYDSDLPEQQPTQGGAPVPPAPAAAATTTPAPVDNWGGKNPIDPDYIRRVIAEWAAMPGADPTLKNDPEYALRRILETGGLRGDNLQYWQDAFVGPKAFFNNPDREKGGASVDLGDDTRQYDDDWFSQNSPAPASYSQLTRPDGLSQPYAPRNWTESFKAPTAEDLLSDPGYIAGRDAIQQGLERSAAAKGSILSGGFAGKALPRALGEYAGSAYKDLVGRAFDTYRQKYGEFSDAEDRNLGARGLNEATFQTDLGNNLNTYKTRYGAYRDVIGDQFDLARLGLNAVQSSRY